MSDELPPLVVERDLPYPVERVWRALTSRELVSRWLMETDLEPVVGHRFTLRARPVPGWSGVTNCEVVEVTPMERLVYTWGDGSESDSGLRTLLTWTLTPIDGGTRLRMEHSGFRAADARGHQGMGGGWPRIVERLDQLVGELG
ncbi:MAG TPA: SRPBCC domain-containing protein [Myxococcota bacterium]|nr:SRPBCC domain-containing protein [Myxococcota bacterium]